MGIGLGRAGGIGRRTITQDMMGDNSVGVPQLIPDVIVEPTREDITSGFPALDSWKTPANTGTNYVTLVLNIDHQWDSTADDYEYIMQAQDPDGPTDTHVVGEVERESDTGLAGNITDDWKFGLCQGWVPRGYNYRLREDFAADTFAFHRIIEWAFGAT